MRLATLEETREIQIQILDKVHEFCRKTEIQYYLIFGTLLGAVRHGGYIPWDDDIDIAMFREDYEKFVETFDGYNSDYHVYELHKTKGYNNPFAKILYKKSVLVSNNLSSHNITMRINIDVFPIDRLPKDANRNRILSRLHLLDKLFFCKAYKIRCDDPLRKKVLFSIGKLSALIVSKRSIGIIQEKIAKQFKNIDTDTYSLIFQGIEKELPLLTIELFEPIEIVFEDRKYIAPKGYDFILESIYGDYMTLPPIKDRVAKHDFRAYINEI